MLNAAKSWRWWRGPQLEAVSSIMRECILAVQQWRYEWRDIPRLIWRKYALYKFRTFCYSASADIHFTQLLKMSSRGGKQSPVSEDEQEPVCLMAYFEFCSCPADGSGCVDTEVCRCKRRSEYCNSYCPCGQKCKNKYTKKKKKWTDTRTYCKPIRQWTLYCISSWVSCHMSNEW